MLGQVKQEIASFRDELMGRAGAPGRLVNLENEVALLSSQLTDTVKDAVTDAVKPLMQRMDRVDAPDATDSVVSRLRAVEQFTVAMRGALVLAGSAAGVAIIAGIWHYLIK